MRHQASRPSPGQSGLSILRAAVAGALLALLLCAWSGPGWATAASEDGQSEAATGGATSEGSEEESDTAPEKDEPSTGSASEMLEVVGGVDGRTVELVACPGPEGKGKAKAEGEDKAEAGTQSEGKRAMPPSCTQSAKESSAHIGGRLTLILKGKAEGALTLEASYVPDEGAPVALTEGGSNWVFLSSAPGKLAKGRATPLTVGFALDKGQSVTAVDGNLVLTTAVGDGKAPQSESTVIPVSGATRQFENLSVQPERLKMGSGQEKATVTLSGADLAEFLAFRGFGTPFAVLNEDGGDTAKVELRLPSVDGQPNPNEATADVVLVDDDVSPGTYTGNLAISEFIADAPAIDIELSSDRCWALVALLFVLMMVVVLIGVVCVALLTRLVAYAVRRRSLQEALDQTVTPFKHVYLFGDIRSWRLGDLIGPGVIDDRKVDEGLHGIQGLRASIETARSSKDLDEDTDRVLDMVARLQRWMRLEPAARRLARVDEQARPAAKLKGQHGERGWAESNAWRDTQVLREIAQREPADAAAADDLAWRLLRQAEWHHRFAAAWQAAAGDAELAKAVLGLDDALGKETTIGTRKPEEQDVLDEKLEAIVQRLDAEERPGPIEWPESLEPKLEHGITEVEWDASPNLFTGWATLDGKSYGQLSRRPARAARKLRWSDAQAELNALRSNPLDLSLTAGTFLLASLAYGLSQYNDTWGSAKDFASAFLAGALGTIVVDWAALPIFESIRLRSSQASEAKASDGDEKDGEGEEDDKKDEEGAKKEDADGEGEEKKPKKPGTPDLEAVVDGIRQALSGIGIR